MDSSPILVEDETILPLIYFISADARVRFPVKIGRSTSKAIRGRLSSLQTGMPYKLDYMVVCEAPPEVEQQVHRAFAHLRLEGEWFKRSRDLTGFIEQLVEADPDWRELTMPRMVFGPGHESPPDDAEDFRRYGMSTFDLHWKRKKEELMGKLFPADSQTNP